MCWALAYFSCKNTGCVSNIGWVAVPVGITDSVVWLKICTNTSRIKKYKSIIKKRVLIGKAKLDAV